MSRKGSTRTGANPKVTKTKVQDFSKGNIPNKQNRYLVVLRWIVTIFLAVLIAGLIAILFVPPKKKNEKTTENNKLSKAVSLINNNINKTLTGEFFTPFNPSKLKDGQYVFVDLKNKALVVVNNQSIDSIYYERLSNNYDNIKLSSVSKGTLDKLLKNLRIEKEYSIDYICKRIKADSTYLSRIIKTSPPEDQILSLLYNTLVGDRKGHLIVSIENGALEIKRSEGLELCALDVNKMLSLAQIIEANPPKYEGEKLDQLFVDNGVYECTTILPTAYLDYRSDCIRVAGQKEITGDRYAELRDTMLNNPRCFCVFQNDSLYTIDDLTYTSSDIRYGIVNREVLQSAEIITRRNYAWIVPILLLVFGIIEGMLIISFFRKQKTKKEPVSTDSNDTINEIRNIISKNEDMETEDRQQLVALLNELLRESNDNQQIQKERDSYRNKYKQLENVLTGDISIISVLKVILEQWGNNQNLESRINESLSNLRDNYINQFKSQEPFKTINLESVKYRELLGCRKESALLGKLNEMQVASGNKMTKISTFALIKDTNPTINDIVQIYDEQTGSNLSNDWQEIQAKARWYDEHYNNVILPVNTLNKSISSKKDRKNFVKSIFNDLLIPMFGQDNKATIEKILQDYLTVEKEAKVYGLLKDTKGGFSYTELQEQLTKVIEKEDAVWLSKIREAARRYSNINEFNDTMWETFVKDFVEKEKSIVEDKDKAWFFGRILEIAYHTADYIRSLKDEGNSIYCYNAKLMASNFDMTNGPKEFSPNNPMMSTEHSRKIYQWANELGVEKMKIVVDNYAIMP